MIKSKGDSFIKKWHLMTFLKGAKTRLEKNFQPKMLSILAYDYPPSMGHYVGGTDPKNPPYRQHMALLYMSDSRVSILYHEFKSLTWFQVFTMSPSLYHRSKSILCVLVNTMSQWYPGIQIIKGQRYTKGILSPRYPKSTQGPRYPKGT